MAKNLMFNIEHAQYVRTDVDHEEIEELIYESTHALLDPVKVDVFVVDELVGGEKKDLTEENAQAVGPEVKEE